MFCLTISFNFRVGRSCCPRHYAAAIFCELFLQECTLWFLDDTYFEFGLLSSKMADFLKAINNEIGIESDLITMCKWVREELFFFLIHDLKTKNDQTMTTEGSPCGDFVSWFLEKDNRPSIVNSDIHGADDTLMTQYLKHLWTIGVSCEATSKTNIRRNLSMEKTAVYAAISDAFKCM